MGKKKIKLWNGKPDYVSKNWKRRRPRNETKVCPELEKILPIRMTSYLLHELALGVRSLDNGRINIVAFAGGRILVT